jgi:hypothetical protein
MSRRQRNKRRAIWISSALTGLIFLIVTLLGPALGGYITR